jgi:hypothetical protein
MLSITLQEREDPRYSVEIKTKDLLGPLQLIILKYFLLKLEF